MEEEEKGEEGGSSRRQEARRSIRISRHPSSRVIVASGDGNVNVQHHVSGVDLLSVSRQRSTNSIIPNVYSQIPIPIPTIFEPRRFILPASEALLSHPQPYNEHLWSLAILGEKFPESRINIVDAHLSLGLSSSCAAQLLSKFGPNVLTPPGALISISSISPNS